MADDDEGQRRRCTGCGQAKPLGDFGRRSPAAGGGPRSRCRDCSRAQSAAYRALHPEQRERFNQWRRALHRLGDRLPGEATGDRDEDKEAEHGEQR